MSNLPNTFSIIAPAFVQGLALSLGLIVAIGAQNAFVLRQGLRREHVGSVVLFCALADAVLIAAGVLGMAQALGEHQEFARALALAGAVFLAVYGWRALRRARQSNQLRAEESGTGLRLAGVLAQAAAFTLLNPHVYLDTVLLVGSIGAQQPLALRPWFVAGASFASLFWFGMLGFGALVGTMVCQTQGMASARWPDWRDHVGIGDPVGQACAGKLTRSSHVRFKASPTQ